MKKKLLIWILVILLLLGGTGATWYLFSIGAIGFELPVATDPVHGDLIGMYQEAPTEPPVTEPAPTEPVPTEPEPTEPVPTNPADPGTETPEDKQEEPRQITAGEYFVYDMRDKKFLTLSCNETARIFPASITKLMTCYTALQHVKPEDVLTVGEEISLIDIDSSRAYLHVGDTLTVRQCIRALLLPSGNDAAYTLAANVGRLISGKENQSASAAISTFISEMNRVAKDLGMENSHFVTCDGMHLAQHYTCARDLAILSHALLNTPEILEGAATLKEVAELEGGKHTWSNTNLLINPKSSYYIPYAMGLKTGYTSYAGNCLLSMFYANDRLYLIGTFQSPTYYGRFADTRQLYQELIASE